MDWWQDLLFYDVKKNTGVLVVSFFLPSLWLCYCSEKQPWLTWVVTDLRTLKEFLSAVGYAWTPESSLTIHLKNSTPTEILFCPQNLHSSGSHSLPFLVTLLHAPSIVVGQSSLSWL